MFCTSDIVHDSSYNSAGPSLRSSSELWLRGICIFIPSCFDPGLATSILALDCRTRRLIHHTVSSHASPSNLCWCRSKLFAQVQQLRILSRYDKQSSNCFFDSRIRCRHCLRWSRISSGSPAVAIMDFRSRSHLGDTDTHVVDADAAHQYRDGLVGHSGVFVRPLCLRRRWNAGWDTGPGTR